MQGYVWAKTPAGELFVVMVTGGKGYVPGVEGAISVTEFAIVEPVKWPSLGEPPSQNSVPQRLGVHAAAATRECVILPFAANG